MGFLNRSLNQAVISLGGKGSRLSKVTLDLPKPLFEINGKSTLERCIENLSIQGIKNYIFLLNFKYEIFLKEALNLEKKYNVKIISHNESFPRGEAGSLRDVLKELDDTFLFINGDIIFDIDLNRFTKFHFNMSADITLATHLTSHPEDSDCIIENPSSSIFDFKYKQDNLLNKYFYLGNAGIALVNKDLISNTKISTSKNISFFKDYAIKNHLLGKKVLSYNTTEYIKDMGTEARLKQVSQDLKNKLVNLGSYKKKQKALFLDRDNTLIKCPEKKYITKENQIYFYQDRLKKIAEISRNFNIVILISNQPQIAMGKIAMQEVINLNGLIINYCKEQNLNIGVSTFCPHHPDFGFENEVRDLKLNCFCRKPSPGMFLEQKYLRNIEIKNSLLIGDSWRDKKAAENLNIKFLHAKELDSSPYF